MASSASPENLVRVLQRRAQASGEQHAYRFLRDGEEESGVITYQQLDIRARSLGRRLQELGAAGERVLLFYPAGIDFIVAFFACLYAGAIAVPSNPPGRGPKAARPLAIARDARPKVVLTTAVIEARAQKGNTSLTELQAATWLATDRFLEQDPSDSSAAQWKVPDLTPNTPALLQYTSGSTGSPRGVVVRHGHLIHNEALIQSAFEVEEDSVIVGWLPQFHDMGLIGNVLQPIYSGASGVLMSPMAFLQNPGRWLRAISRYRGTVSGGPDFAYQLCAERLREQDCGGLDLSSWRVAFNGSEPVRASTLERFVATFERYGFCREAFYPCYGLAEATLFVSGGVAQKPPIVRHFEDEALDQGVARESAVGGDKTARALVGCGHCRNQQQVVIVEPASHRPCRAGRVGEIWVAGPSVAGGYWNRPDETAQTFEGRLGESPEESFLRTGDLGFLVDGELFVTGRIKDLVIIRGRNHYPQDLEWVAESSHPALRPGSGAAVAVDVEDEERLVMIHEVTRRAVVDVDEVAEAIRRRVVEQHEVAVYEVVLVREGTIPRTSSGKIQRHACRAAYLDWDLTEVGRHRLPAADPVEQASSEETSMGKALFDIDPKKRRTELERVLRQQVARVLQVAPGLIGRDTELSALGMDSLAAAELQGVVDAELGVAPSLVMLLNGSTLGQVAEEITVHLATPVVAGADTPPEWLPVAEGPDHPLSRGQRAMWFQEQLTPGTTAFLLGGALRVEGNLDRAALQRALVRLITRHPVLRTTFPSVTGEPRQVVHQTMVVDLVAEEAVFWSEVRLEQRMSEFVRRPFDKDRGPLLRLGLFRRGPAEQVLVLSIHHLISDLWSIGLFLHELAAFYREESGGPAAELPALARGYTDYVQRQEKLVNSNHGKGLWAFWQEELSGELSSLSLPTDRPRAAVPKMTGSLETSRLRRAVVAAVEARAQRHGATPFMVLLAALQVLLHRFTGQDEVLVGAPTTGRMVPEMRGVMGYFVNPVVARGSFTTKCSFDMFLEATRRRVLTAFEHQEFPFQLLAERLNPERAVGYAPVFQAMLVFQQGRLPGLGAVALGTGGVELELFGLRCVSLPLPCRDAQLDLALYAAPREGGLDLALEYPNELFDAVTMRRFLGHFQVLLGGILAAPGRRISELQFLTPPERAQLLLEWNERGATHAPACLHDLVMAQVYRTPASAAVVCGRTGETLTYHCLEQWSAVLSRDLEQLGVGPEVRVGVCLPRTPELVVAILGVLRCGGVYVPIDPAYPVERQAFMLADSAAQVLVTEAKLAECLDTDLPRLFLGEPPTEPAKTALATQGDPENLSHVIYTSGSTGLPKGVAIRHAGASAMVDWSLGRFHLDELRGVLLSTSVCFDLSVFEIFVPLACGGSVMVAENALGLADLAVRDRVTLLNTVPSVMGELVRQGLVPASVRTVNLAGEPLRRELADAVYAGESVEQVYNLYGPSEDTTYSTWTRVPRRGRVTIGRPILGTQAFLLDRAARPVPLGGVGELFLGGDGLARGYLGRPRLSAECFIPDPFGSIAGGRLYRTGDQARYLSGGELDFLGRIDDQVKVRGFRIELGEIESAVLRHSTVRECIVVAREESERGVALVSYVAGDDPQSEQLRAFLRTQLPEVMIPAVFVVLERLPLLPNGKVDRDALPSPDRSAAQRRYVAPRDQVEEALAEIWCRVLELNQVGAEDDFFALGGHSLLATRIISQVRETFEVELAVRDLFSAPTLSAQASRIEALCRENRTPAPVSRLAGSPHPELSLPLSFAQERMWFLEQLEPGSVAYNIPAAARMRGILDVAILKASLVEVVRRHEVLRTVFQSVSGRPVQVFSVAPGFSFQTVDLGGLSASQREAVGWSLALAEGRRPFDLAVGPLLRATLLRLDPEEHLLLLTLHHIVFDGWSLGILLRELGALYGALMVGKPSPLPEIEVHYTDFARWQRKWLDGEVLAAQLDYWREQLLDVPVLELPTDRSRSAVPQPRSGALSVALDKELSEAVGALAQRTSSTLFMTLLAGFSTLLSRLTGQMDVAVGSPVAGRDRLEVEGLIGFFVNTLVLRSDLSAEGHPAGPMFEEFLARVRETTLGAFAHQDVPFEKLVAELQPERQLNTTPFFQVMFVLQNIPLGPLELPGLVLEPFELDGETAKFDLTLLLRETEEGLCGVLKYHRDLFDLVTMRRFVKHFETLLGGLVAASGERLGELPLLDAVERHQLFQAWNDTEVEIFPNVCLHELFQVQVPQSADAVAVVIEGLALSYGELERRANLLARHLRSLGVGPEVLTGICVERSLEMVVGLLGILKAGGAYVPLDTSYPKERLAFMLADTQVPVLLSTQQVAASLPTNDSRVLCLDRDWPMIEKAPLKRPHAGARPTPANLAYVIYTSGSTGRPKGAMNSHGGIVNRLLWTRKIAELGADDRVLQKAPSSFDVSVWEIFWPLMSGACLVLARPGGHRDSAYLVRLIAERSITSVHFVPSQLQVFLDLPDLRRQCQSLRRVFCGGEELGFDLEERALSRLGVPLYNYYGPTEAAVEVTFWASSLGGGRRTVPIGRPLSNLQIYLLDRRLRPVPVGVVGELCIGGIGLARAYWRRARLTALKFVPDGFFRHGIPGASDNKLGRRLYKTGDLARYQADGAIEFMGRLDHQIKLRGVRLELGEIEAALREEPTVREAVVLVLGERPVDLRLVAFVVTKVATPEELHARLATYLPEVMVPSGFVLLERLPWTANGKVDRAALRRMASTTSVWHPAQARYAAPCSPAEELLAGIWCELLGVENAGLGDNFFEMGGHSLLATQAISRIRESFGVELPLRTLFEAPTVGALALRLEAAQGLGTSLLEAPPFVAQPRAGELPLSFAQERLWFLDQLEPDALAYHIAAAVRLRGPLKYSAFAASLGEVVRRHEALRTVFRSIEGRPVQIIARVAEVAFPTVDLAGLDPSRQETVTQRLAAAEARIRFDLTSGPLLRATLLHLGRERHVVLLTMHHIVSDGWSTGVLIRELGALYEAFTRGEPSPLPELVAQYADFACWQRQWLQGEVLEAQLGYWRERLAAVPVLELPSDQQRAAVPRPHTGTLQVLWGKELSSALEAVSRREVSTLFMTLLAGFSTLLSRYTGEKDVAVGSPIAGRNRLQVERLIGFFVNTLVLRNDLSGPRPGGPSFRELLSRVREVTLGAFAHQDVPFEKLVAELQPERQLHITPLFQVMLVLQNTPVGSLQLPGLVLEPLEVESETAKFDLTLLMGATNDGLSGILKFRRDRFDMPTVQRLSRHLEILLEGIVADPEQRLGDLPLLSAAEQHQLVEGWNDTRTEIALDRCLHELFESWVTRQRDAIAAVFESTWLSHQELNDRANQLARCLWRLGTRPEQPVGVSIEPSLEMLVAVLGILKSGGAYLPLAEQLPPNRQRFMLEDAGARIVLAGRQRLELPGFQGAALSLREVLDGAAVPSENGSQCRVRPGNAAYVIYTSGTTGRPKGVLIEHRHAVSYVGSLVKRIRFRAGMRHALMLPIAVDSSITSLFGSLATGGCLHLFTSEQSTDAGWVAEYFATRAIDCLKIAPSHLAALYYAAEEGCVFPRQRLVCGGEAASGDWIDELRAAADGDREIYNHYGPTETTVGVLVHQVGPRADRPAKVRIPIGRPLGNRQAYILSEALLPVGVGVCGELYLGGEGISRGYLRRPALSASVFVPDALSQVPGARLYRTGDRVRFLSNGEIEFLGRVDHQVKLRGFRIELGEIEASLGRHPGVRVGTVSVQGNTPEASRLVAYWVAEPSGSMAEELHSFLSRQLPSYMVPSSFVQLEALPILPNGKVDRKSLPDPGAVSRSDGRSYVAPRNQVEQITAQIWSEVLTVQRVGVHDNFFDLGGHSLLATQAISRVRKAFGVELPLRRLFEEPTLGALAANVEVARARGESLEKPALHPMSREGDLPVSFAQERLWFLEQFEPGRSAYHIPAAVRLRGILCPTALAASFAEVVRRHEVLRTVFRSFDGHPVQVIAAASELMIPLLDLSRLNAPRREAATVSLAAAEARRPFDLSAGPLLRTTLLRLGRQEHVMLLTVHHIVSDGWSTGVLIRELEALYEAFSRGEPSPLPELSLQYADFALWQRRWLQGEVLEAQLNSWREQLLGLPVLELPTDRPRSAVRSTRGGTLRVTLDSELSSALKALAQREVSTLFMVLLAAFSALLSRFSDQEDVVVGSPIAGRNHLELEELIGFFVNTLVLRNNLSTGEHSDPPSFREVLARVREVVLSAYAHQDVPFEKLVAELKPERDLSTTPLFQVMFALQNTPRGALELPGLILEELAVDSGTAKFDLSLALRPQGEGYSGTLEYPRDLFDSSTVRRFWEHFVILLGGIVENPDSPLVELPLLSAAQQQLLAGWNDTEKNFPATLTIHQLFESEAERSADAVAVVFGNQELSYGELDRRANQLAHHLRDLGVGPEMVVGLCLERSLEMVVATLGVLKAGGAYLPLDPGYPKERLAFMLKDTQAVVLLTQVRWVEEVLTPVEIPWICLDRPSAQIIGQPTTPPSFLSRAQNLAYVMYTSGSTGRPKGVLVIHRGVVRLVRGNHFAALTPEQTFLQHAPISFDAATLEIWGPLLNGGRLEVYEAEQPSFSELGRFLAERRVNTLWFTAGLFQQMVDTHLEGLRPVQQLLAGGDVVAPDAARKVLEELDGCTLLNCYGPTENTTFTSCHVLQSVAEGQGSLSIGRPIANSWVKLLDRRLQPVPIGVPGQLTTGGEGLARGYHRRPALTAARFIPEPSAAQPGARLYLTGDQARYLGDGTLDFLGRKDHQVKVRGFRIELGEIETALAGHPRVRETVVLASEYRPGDQRLVAYIVLDGDGELAQEALRQALERHLPPYMIPNVFMFLEALPLTPNGKVDRRALPDPTASDRPDHQLYVAPRSPVEQTMVDIWSEVLGIEQVGVHDNFFELGGHSFLAMQIVSRIGRAFAVELPVRSLFEAPTVEMLAGKIGSASCLKTPPLLPFDPKPAELPLTFQQERSWFVDELTGRQDHSYSLYEIEGPLHISALEASFNRIIKRQESLRTAFQTTNGQPVQVILPHASVSLSVIDLSKVCQTFYEPVVRKLLIAGVTELIDLGHPPPLRLTLLQMAPERYLLLQTVHHIIFDGWSWVVLFGELSQFYGAHLEGEEISLDPLPIQYSDFALWQRQWLRGAVLENEIAYWRRKFRSSTRVLEHLADRPLSSRRGRALKFPFRLPREHSEALREIAQKQGVTLLITTLTLFEVLLFRLTGRQDISLATYATGRTRLETEGLLGYFAGVVGLRSVLDPKISFRQALDQVGEETLDAFARQQDLPFEKLVSELYPEIDLRNLSEVTFVFDLPEDPRVQFSLPGVEIRPVLTDEVIGRVAKDMEFGLRDKLNLRIVDEPDEIRGYFYCNEGIFQAATGERLARSYERLVQDATARPDDSLEALFQAAAEAEERQKSARAEELNTTKLHRLRAGKRKAVKF